MLQFPPWDIERLLVIEPHPDDYILMAGGLSLKLRKSGGEIYVLTLTNGGAADKDAEKLKEQRYAESQQADAILGTSCRVTLDYETRALWDHTSSVYNDLLAQIRRIQPDTIVTMHKDYKHPDHNWIAEFILPLIFQVGEPIRMDLGHPVYPLLLLGENPRSYLEHPNVYVPIEDEISDKIKAMMTQESQLRILGKRISDGISTLAAFRGMNADPVSMQYRFCEAYELVETHKKIILRD